MLPNRLKSLSLTQIQMVMKKFFKWFSIVMIVLIALLWGGFQYMSSQTKKASPEAEAKYASNGKELTVKYCRPSKKDRVIFGELVPYGKVWRAGANEATTFVTNTDLIVGGKALPAGKYTLWITPQPNSWTIHINSGEYSWGVSWGGKASRKAELDVVAVEVPVQLLDKIEEQFLINFADSPLRMQFTWDKVLVELPLE